MVKPIAIYLPQYHPVPENDRAWGKGFTEWDNVRKAKPLFNGHYQPHIPHDDIGYYNLLDPEILVKQADIARNYGIYGFAFYHYWFQGKRLLEQPLDVMLDSGEPNFPFCFIWANEPWTALWDGGNDEVIQPQIYSHKDDLNHIRFLCEKVFSDRRYIKINGKPVFIVYRAEQLPDIKKTVEIWRKEVKEFGFPGIYLIRVENFFLPYIDPSIFNFDAAMEFAPDLRCARHAPIKHKGDIRIFDYSETVRNMARKKYPYTCFRCVFPGWDNTARKSDTGYVFVNNDPDAFKESVFMASQYTAEYFDKNSRFFFINAWNEWGEGCHIEPDVRNGYAHLEIISEVIKKNDKMTNENEVMRDVQSENPSAGTFATQITETEQQRSLISVLIPLYNSEPFLAETIDSILNQTYDNFELLLVDDGSTDDTEKIVKSYLDKRIKYFRRPHNFVGTLNFGLDNAKGEYIALMDHDDIMLPGRLEKQCKFMNENRDVMACGGCIKRMGMYTDVGVPPLEYEDLIMEMAVSSPMYNPTGFLRTKELREKNVRYQEGYSFAADYKFWSDVVKVGKVVNLLEILTIYRIYETQASRVHQAGSAVGGIKTQQEMVNYIYSCYSGDDETFEFLDKQYIPAVNFLMENDLIPLQTYFKLNYDIIKNLHRDNKLNFYMWDSK